ncbi:MAG: type II toxin-antitoxin system Phd/YefM family antitoxin [Candidatus Sumerlaeaceae bacterium]
MKTYNATQFKAHALQIMKEISGSGEPVLVTRRGEPLVEINPARPTTKAKPGHLAGTAQIVGDIVSPVFPEWESLEPNRRKTPRK